MDPALGFEKRGGAFGSGVCQDFCRGPFFADPAFVHNDNARTDLPYDVDVVRDKKERRVTLSVDVCHELQELS